LTPCRCTVHQDPCIRLLIWQVSHPANNVWFKAVFPLQACAVPAPIHTQNPPKRCSHSYEPRMCCVRYDWSMSVHSPPCLSSPMPKIKNRGAGNERWGCALLFVVLARHFFTSWTPPIISWTCGEPWHSCIISFRCLRNQGPS